MPTLKDHDRRFPRCTTWDGYKEWREQGAGAAAVNSTDPGFCTDCLPWYQKAMCDKGLCDHPEVLFYRSEDGSVFGCEEPLMLHVALKV